MSKHTHTHTVEYVQRLTKDIGKHTDDEHIKNQQRLLKYQSSNGIQKIEVLLQMAENN